MENLNKRSFLKIFGFSIGGFFASTALGKLFSTPNKAQLIYRIDFPTELSKEEFSQISSRFFNKNLHAALLKEIGVSNAIQKKFERGPRFVQKIVTFPSSQSLQTYVQQMKERKSIIDHNAMIDNGYKISFKVIS